MFWFVWRPYVPKRPAWVGRKDVDAVIGDWVKALGRW